MSARAALVPRCVLKPRAVPGSWHATGHEAPHEAPVRGAKQMNRCKHVRLSTHPLPGKNRVSEVPATIGLLVFAHLELRFGRLSGAPRRNDQSDPTEGAPKAPRPPPPALLAARLLAFFFFASFSLRFFFSPPGDQLQKSEKSLAALCNSHHHHHHHHPRMLPCFFFASLRGFRPRRAARPTLRAGKSSSQRGVVIQLKWNPAHFLAATMPAMKISEQGFSKWCSRVFQKGNQPFLGDPGKRSSQADRLRLQGQSGLDCPAVCLNQGLYMA